MTVSCPRACHAAFSAGEDARVPMTWGQRAIWEPLQWFGHDTAQFNNQRSITLARPVSVECFMGAVRALAERHQALRTHFAAGEQHIAGSGDYTVELCHGDVTDAVAVAARLAARPFDLESEWPARIAAIRGEAGLVTAAAIATSHVAMDGWALDRFTAELAALLDGRDGTQGPTWEPLDQVGFETSARGQRVSAAAIAHWRAGLALMPPTMFDFPATPACGPPVHRYLLESAAVSAAAPVLARRTRTSVPTVLLTVTALLLAARTGHDMCALQVIAGNRVRHRHRLLCAPTAQNGLMVLPVPRDASLAGAVREAARPATEAYLQGHYDPADLAAVRAEIETARGARFDLSAYFNFHHHTARWAQPQSRAALPSAEGLARLRGQTRLTRLAPLARHDMKFYVNVTGRPGSPEAALLLLANTEYLPEPTGERILRGIETLLCEALAREVTVAEIAGLAGLAPAHRGEGWCQTGAGWAHLPTVAGLVRQATGDPGAAVFHRPATDAEPAGLVAFTRAATDPLEVVHRRVMGALSDETCAIAPAWYVITRQAPGDPASLAAWDALPAVASGTGRPA